MTVLFALYNGYLGIAHRSVWTGSICVYYLILVLIRSMVILAEKRPETERSGCEYISIGFAPAFFCS